MWLTYYLQTFWQIKNSIDKLKEKKLISGYKSTEAKFRGYVQAGKE